MSLIAGMWNTASMFAYKNTVQNPNSKSEVDDQKANWGGLLNTYNQDTDKSVESSFNTKDARIYYSQPINHTLNFTITDSEVADTGNTQYANPTQFSPTTTQRSDATHSDSESSGIDLTSILVPVAGITGVAAVAFLLLGNDDVKKAVSKKVGGKKKNE